MMKRLAAAILAAMMLCGCAFAERFDEPALRDPKTRYEVYFEQTDGSEMSLFMLMDAMNDEQAIVDEYGALVVHMDFVDETGEKASRIDNYLQMSDFGRMQIVQQGKGILAIKVYVVGGMVYSTMLGQLSVEQMQSAEEFEQLWESYKFPYGPIDILHGVRQDEAGNTYALVRSDDVYTFEYVMTGEMEIREIRTYVNDEEGIPVLESIVTYETC